MRAGRAPWLSLAGLAALSVPAAWSQPATAPYGPDSAQAWARGQIAAGKEADFNLRCAKVQRVTAPDPCRTLTAALVQDLVMANSNTDQRHIDLANALIVGDLELSDAEVGRELSIRSSLIDGEVKLARARFASRLSFEGSTLVGTLDGSGLHVGADLRLESATFHAIQLNEADIRGPLSLHAAAVATEISLDNASVGADLNLSNASLHGVDGRGMQVGGRIFAADQGSAGTLDFTDAVTRGDIFLSGKVGAVRLDSVHVGSTLHMENGGVPGSLFEGMVDLDAAQIDHYWNVAGATFQRDLTAESVHVGQQVVLADARFNGGFDLKGARIDGGFAAQSTTWARPVSLRLMHVGQDLDLASATLAGLDLSGSVIEGMLQLGLGGGHTCWAAPAKALTDPPAPAGADRCARGRGTWLTLTNTRAGAVEGSNEAWPVHLELSGFTYGHIKGPETAPGAKSDQAWQSWLQRDGRYSPQPYLQLASVLAADGDRDDSLAMQFASREHERAAALRDRHDWTWAFLSLLCVFGGYGIGDYTWRALIWVAGLTVVGAVCVWWIRRHESRNLFWPLGASLEKLLPYVNLDRSFTEFFEQQRNFRLWHKLVFGMLAVMGSILGLFLAAAVSGLTQKG